MLRYHVTLPELGMDGGPIVVSQWLVERGSRVESGEPVLEVLAGAATVDLPAPADGVLVETLVGEDEPLHVGQRLAAIEGDCEAGG
jgi:pyruvate/2-oxoglutarate dehydrogenase complex dihydrolipoamide acyltransferase (E2) component